MIVVVIVLAVVAAVAIVLAVLAWVRLRGERRRAETLTAELSETVDQRDAAASRATEAEAARATADEEATTARAAAEQANAAVEQAKVDTERAKADADALRAAKGGVDPQLLWTLEQARSERTWRQSVAIGPDAASALAGADEPLREALQVELDAAREDVGAIVELDADLPATMTAAGSVLVLRAAQELLARAVKAAEETTLRIRTEDDDVVVTIVASNEDGQPVTVEPLAIPQSPDMAPTDGGVRVRGAAAPQQG